MRTPHIDMNRRISDIIFNIEIQGSKPAVGKVLVAEPLLEESYFHHAVILLAEYSRGGSSMGLTLNKPTQYTLDELMPDYNLPKGIPVFKGGPMENERLFYVHRLGYIIDDSIEVAPGVWIGGNWEQVCSYLRSGYNIDGDLRFIMGYSGWDAGQLDGEFGDHVWTATTVSPELILKGSDDAYWHRTVRSLGSRYRGWRYHPVAPSLN